MKIHRAALVIGLSFAVLFAISVRAQTSPQPSPQTSSPINPQARPSPVTTETQPGFTVVGLSVRTTNQAEAGGNGLIPPLWQRAMQQGSLESIPHRADNNITLVYTNYASDNNGEYTYVLGVRVSAVDKVPDGMVTVAVPGGKYAVVESDQGSLPEVLPKVWLRINTMPAAKLGGQRAYKADFEVYPEGFDWQNAQIPIHLGLKQP
jgi:predicted transcriptional regulator YdeE